MVATRRGVLVSSPTKTRVEQPSDIQATPSTRRTTRSSAAQADSPTGKVLQETGRQLQEADLRTSVLKRCSRASRLHSPEQPCTPLGSDVSDLESCCSDVNARVTRSSRRRPASQEEEDLSEAESCSSLVQINVRRTRKKAEDKKEGSSSSAVSEAEAPRKSRTVKHEEEEEESEAESCSSDVQTTRTLRSTRKTIPVPKSVRTDDVKVDLAPKSRQRVTRSQRQSVRPRRSSKRRAEDSDELSDAESVEASHSEVRRSTRTRSSEDVFLSSPTPRRTRRTSAAAEEKSCDSESFESGPEFSLGRRDKTWSSSSNAPESDSEGGGTPCSSRTGSGSSRRRASIPVMKNLYVVLENAREEILLDNSVLDSTVVSGDADGTLLEEDKKTGEDLSGDVGLEVDPQAGDVTLEDRRTGEDPTEDGKGEEEDAIEVLAEASHLEDWTEDGKGEEEDAIEVLAEPSHLEDWTEDGKGEEEDCSEVLAEASHLEDWTEDGKGEEEEDASEVLAEASHLEEDKTSKDSDDVAEVALEDCDGEAAVASADQQGELSAEEREDELASVEEAMETKCEDVLDDTPARTSEVEVTDHAEAQAPPKHRKAACKEFSLSVSSDEEDEEVSEEDEDAGEIPDRPWKPQAAPVSVDGVFMVDTRVGGEASEDYLTQPLTKEELVGGKDDKEFVDEEDQEDQEVDLFWSSKKKWTKKLSTVIDPGISVRQLGGLYITLNGSQPTPGPSCTKKPKEKKVQDEVMKKSVMKADFEKKDTVPPYSESKRALKKQHRAEREKTTGDGWFNMKAPELTNELQGDLKLLKMRGSLDPKRFYKKNDRDGFPKYFQMATVVDNPLDFYHSRVPKKQRKRTMVEELLADEEFRHKNKKKYLNIMAEKAAQAAGKKNSYRNPKFVKMSKKAGK
ncbi:deoxynucleotidyltransferase terminal-interacting protein 2 [Entelurus aequoreus]|uniref:deoxynucleotidyltransferase terminal-interacting protein 2 n=1 Tax=Entelurus aequoreus TaxID=161455 RepID=UPI002B1E1532|nr:deoxynucleotidyltransferase terminal-interacting protein 2 [Entelurus aequoreus]